MRDNDALYYDKPECYVKALWFNGRSCTVVVINGHRMNFVPLNIVTSK
jgi:hypothetical protein